MKRILLFFAFMMTSIMMLAHEESNEYIPFVELGKWWHVVRSDANPEFYCRLGKYWMAEEVELDGKKYVRTSFLDDELATWEDTGLFREENRRVYKYDEKTGRDIMLYDFSLKEGDTFTYEISYNYSLNCKVLKQGWLEVGPKIVTSCTLTPADTLDIKYRQLRTWTIGEEDDRGVYHELGTWVEGVGALDNMFDKLGTHGMISYLAYVERKDNVTRYSKNDYLPFSFHNILDKVHGSNLPTGEETHSEDVHHQLTYVLEGNSLHVYGNVFTQCGPNNYAYFYEKKTDDPLVHKIEFEIQEAQPLMDCMALHATNFYVQGFNPNINYIVIDNQGEEHPVINKTTQMAYRPFVEDGKVWKMGNVTSGNPVQWVDYYYYDGDTIIDGKTCKQMMRQRYVNPDYAETHDLSQDHIYVGAWYEENKKVYEYDTTNKQFKLMYDFSLEDNGTFQVNDLPYVYVVGPRQTGGMKYFKGVYRDIVVWADGESYKCAPWLEGVGVIYAPPTTNVFNVELGDPMWFLMSCTVGDEVIYLIDDYEDGTTPKGARKKRFDFTHTIKTQPKARTRSGEDQSLYGEYNELKLGLNLNSLDDTYMVHITDETGKVVYEKNVNASNIVGLNIDISAYSKGCYTVTVENSQETFTGKFDALSTGIEEVRSKKEETGNVIYNLQGQRLSTLQKGLNIVNGQKIYVK